MNAIDRGDTQAVLDALRWQPQLANARHSDSFGATALIHAVNREDRAMIDLLLDHGADIDQRSDWWAGSFGVLDGASDELSAHLLKRGATLTAHAAARLGMIDIGAWFPRLSSRTIGSHLHDVDGIADHRAPGNGDVDWSYIAAGLPPEALRVFEIDQRQPDDKVAAALPFLRERGVV